jgi:hypothetical protein
LTHGVTNLCVETKNRKSDYLKLPENRRRLISASPRFSEKRRAGQAFRATTGKVINP